MTTQQPLPLQAAPPTPSPRAAPHNLEAEQALLGAILINNEAHDRVAGFLEPQHFYDPLHQQIYETAAKLIAAGKQATPITLKTFFTSSEPVDGSLTIAQYLGRLAANAASDGYTILFVSSTLMVNPSLYNKIPYDPFKSFIPISNLSASPHVFFAHPSLPMKSMRELVDAGTITRDEARLHAEVPAAFAG